MKKSRILSKVDGKMEKICFTSKVFYCRMRETGKRLKMNKANRKNN